jgi:MoaA/NifB/PqqE/SkfB family radical SAM enzyme
MFNEYIRNIEFELTNRCNAACPLCYRSGPYKGGLSESVYTSGAKDLDVSVHKHIIESLNLDKIEALDYGGCFGDPLMHPRVLEILKHAEGVYQEVQTNASLQTQKFWKESAKIKGLRMWFHLDGLEDTNHLYRRLTNWEKIERNAKTFLDAGGKASWVFIVFKHNEHQVEEARELSKKWGFDEFIVKKTAREMKLGEITEKKMWTKEGIHTFSYEPPQNPEYIAEKVLNGSKELPIDCYSEKRGTYYVNCENEVWPCCVIGSHSYFDKHQRKTQVDRIFHDIHFNTVIDPMNNTFDNIIKNYDDREEIFRLNWDARKYKHCVGRCGNNSTCQKVHITLEEGGGSKRFDGWSGMNNLRNL